jgi:hypothetical protein
MPLDEKCLLCENERKYEVLKKAEDAVMEGILGHRLTKQAIAKLAKAQSAIDAIHDQAKLNGANGEIPPSARGTGVDLAYVPRGQSDLRPAPLEKPQVNLQVFALFASSIGGALMFSPLWAESLMWHVGSIIAAILLLLIGWMMWQMYFVLKQRQQERYAQWILDAGVPREVAEELRAYCLGRGLINQGVWKEDMLELTDEAKCWMISFPQMDMHPESMQIDLGLPAKVVDVKDVPLSCEVEKVKSPTDWIMLEEIALRDRQAPHHREADAPSR